MGTDAGALKGVAFDLDGVLWESSSAHEEAFRLAFGAMGMLLPGDFYGAVAGLRTEDAVRRLIALQGQDESSPLVHSVATAKRRHARLLLADRVQPNPACAPVLATARVLGLRVAIVTGASVGTVNVFLEKLGRAPFEAIVTAGDEIPGKPDSAPYLLAARRLKLAPRECLAVEDSDAGILSARSAGMRVVQLSQNGLHERPPRGVRRVEALSEVSGVLKELVDGVERGR